MTLIPTLASNRQIQRRAHSHTCDFPSHMCTHIKAPSPTTLVANHRTKRDSSQQGFPLISYRKQQGGSAGGFVTPGRRYSSIAGRGWKSDTSTKLRMSGCLSDIKPPHCSWPVATRFYFSIFLKKTLCKYLLSGHSQEEEEDVWLFTEN